MTIQEKDQTVHYIFGSLGNSDTDYLMSRLLMCANAKEEGKGDIQCIVFFYKSEVTR